MLSFLSMYDHTENIAILNSDVHLFDQLKLHFRYNRCNRCTLVALFTTFSVGQVGGGWVDVESENKTILAFH